MKIVIASDIHGSAAWCRRLDDFIVEQEPDHIILLGDLLYHGPRNDLSYEYNPAAVATILNQYTDRIIAVRGNCDSEVDQDMFLFPCMSDYAIFADGDVRMFCTHGHLYSPYHLPPQDVGTAFLSGHTHVKTNEVRDSIRFFNPGSVSIPRDGSHSCGLYVDGAFSHHEL